VSTPTSHSPTTNPSENDAATLFDHNQPALSISPSLPDLELIIAQAVAKSNQKLAAELQQTQEKFAQLESDIAKLHQIILENANKVATVTSEATIAALTGPNSPFVTKADNVQNQQQHVQTQVQISNMQNSLNQLLDTFTAVMNQENNSSLGNLQTPPRERKVPRLSPDTDRPPFAVELPADSSATDQARHQDGMAVDGGVGKD
jgi:peptidoglycan hydrolase CwlO-like protein